MRDLDSNQEEISNSKNNYKQNRTEADYCGLFIMTSYCILL